MSAFGRRDDQDLAGQTFNGIELSGGSWFGIVIAILAVFVIAAVISGWRSPGHGPRWLTTDGAMIGSISIFMVALSHMLAGTFFLANDPGTGFGVILAVIGGAVASIGAYLWTRTADHSPLHPLSADVSWGRVVGVGIAVLFLVIGMFSGWSFDGRQDVVVTPELQAEIDALRAEATANPADAGPIAARLSALMAQAQASGAVVTDGIDGEGTRFGLWTTVAGLVALGATLLASGVFGRDEQKQWIWSAVTAGIGAGIMLIPLAWIVTHVRSADNNYVTGVGSFMAFLAGAFIVASTMSVLNEFRRSRVYEDEDGPDVVEVTTAATDSVEVPV
jgi:riboflavin transporter FmnP